LTTFIRRLLAASLSFAFFVPAVAADDYPRKPITIVVGYAAGGTLDSLMRAIGPRLTEELKQPIVIDNRPGANEAIAAQAVAKSPADGYTLLAHTEGPMTMNQFLYQRLSYAPEKDFAPITQMVRVPLVLVAPASAGFNTLQDFVRVARSRKDKPLIYGSMGQGGVTHLPMVAFAQQSGIEFVHAPYKGATTLLPDLFSGDVEVAFLAVSAVSQYVDERKLKAIAISGPTRASALPNTPTFTEAGIKDVQATFIMALSAPAGTPAPILDRLSSAVRKIIFEPDFQAKYLKPTEYAPVGSTPQEFAKYLANDRTAQAQRIKISGVKFD